MSKVFEAAHALLDECDKMGFPRTFSLPAKAESALVAFLAKAEAADQSSVADAFAALEADTKALTAKAEAAAPEGFLVLVDAIPLAFPAGTSRAFLTALSVGCAEVITKPKGGPVSALFG